MIQERTGVNSEYKIRAVDGVYWEEAAGQRSLFILGFEMWNICAILFEKV
jgi:hypothetical protein